MSLRFYPVILSGGSGTRLWPMSRKLLPKQFLALLSTHTLFPRDGAARESDRGRFIATTAIAAVIVR
jgi:mannose-1-phosphate guanylyltransferase